MPTDERIADQREGVASAVWVAFGCGICQMGLGLAYFFGVLLTSVVGEFGWSRADYAAASSALLLSMGLTSPVIGALTDRFGARVVLSGSILLAGSCLWLFSAMTEIWHFYAISLLFGLALVGVGDIPVGAVASRWFSKNRGTALAFVYAGSNLGGVIVTFVAARMIDLHSWQIALRTIGTGAIVLLLPFALFLVRNPPAGYGDVDETGSDAPQDSGVPLRDAIRTRTFWMLGALLFAFYFYYLGINLHLAPFLEDRGFTKSQAALGYGTTIGLGIIGKITIGLLADRIPTKASLFINFALLAVGSLVLLAIGVPYLLPAFLFIHGFTVNAENVLLPLVVTRSFGVRFMARIYGVLMLALPLGGISGQILAGHIHDRLGQYDIAFMTFVALNVLGLVALALVRVESETFRT